MTLCQAQMRHSSRWEGFPSLPNPSQCPPPSFQSPQHPQQGYLSHSMESLPQGLCKSGIPKLCPECMGHTVGCTPPQTYCLVVEPSGVLHSAWDNNKRQPDSQTSVSQLKEAPGIRNDMVSRRLGYHGYYGEEH